ncbi:MAG: PEP/pyruvate-binding domain-containing protein [Bacteroides sp.]|jgi:pyruvate,water dikinase|nr:PEP/pyruvate-binding domain-containing protein [Bacteroides sp.]
MNHFLVDINKVPGKAEIGNKARSIQALQRKKFRVPKTFVVLPDARDAFQVSPDKTLERLKISIEAILDPCKLYAIRSSANLEDQEDHSFAGQFKTLLNVQGPERIMDAVREVWFSADQSAESAYARAVHKVDERISMAVIIQEMVEPEWSGVAFSINPVNGRREVVVEAVKGLGDSLVQDGKSPYRFVYAQGNWENSGEEGGPDFAILNELIGDIGKLNKKGNRKIDLEWAYDRDGLIYLQLRSVTVSRFPTVYSNHMSREMLPGLIKPLVWSVNIPLVNGAWINLLESVIGPIRIKPEQLSKAFYYRTYFNMGTLGALFAKMGLSTSSLENMMARKDPSRKTSFKPSPRTFLLVPRMLWFLLSNLNIAKRFERNIDRLSLETEDLENRLENNFEVSQFRAYYQELFKVNSKLVHFNIVIPLLMHITSGIFMKKLKKICIDYSDDFIYHEFPQIRDFNPQYRLGELRQMWETLNDEEREEIAKSLFYGQEEKNGSAFEPAFNEFIRTFGHFSESGNDLSVPPWKEDKEFVLNVLIRNASVDRLKANVDAEDIDPLAPIRKNKSVLKKCRRAGRYRLYREIISSEYTRGYGLFRTLFLKAADHLTAQGILDNREDVFYLDLKELELLLDQKNSTINQNIKDKVLKVRQDMKEAENITLPSVIYGEIPPLVPKSNEQLMTGIPVSPGYFEGEVLVIKGYRDFHKATDGCVLVIPFSDVGWTPILTKAGAIVSESGGILSHVSIIARELGIPAMTSVDHACNLEDGTFVKLDCNNGSLIIQEKS